MSDPQHPIERAIAFALRIHGGQQDRHGAPYILHPLTVALKCESEDEIIAALLHDVLEDSETTLDDLRNEGFSEPVIGMVHCLSRRPSESYDEYIDRVLSNPGAMRVKLRDLEHNLDGRRIADFNPRDAARFERYIRAWQRIKSEMRGTQE